MHPGRDVNTRPVGVHEPLALDAGSADREARLGIYGPIASGGPMVEEEERVRIHPELGVEEYVPRKKGRREDGVLVSSRETHRAVTLRAILTEKLTVRGLVPTQGRFLRGATRMSLLILVG